MFIKLILTGALACVLATAQRGGGGMSGGMGEGGEGGMGAGGGRNGDMGATMGNFGTPHVTRLDMMTNLLKLDKDQKKEVKTIMEEGQKEAAPLREQLTRSHIKIGEAVKAGSGQEEAIKNNAELDARMAEVELKAFAKIYKLLDADQKQRTPRLFQMMSGVFKSKNWTEEQ